MKTNPGVSRADACVPWSLHKIGLASVTRFEGEVSARNGSNRDVQFAFRRLSEETSHSFDCT